jgi:hypothetical protein
MIFVQTYKGIRVTSDALITFQVAIPLLWGYEEMAPISEEPAVRSSD